MLSEVLAHRSAPARRRLSGWVWFTLMVGGWAVFFALVLFAESTLSDLWDRLRDLPLVVEGLIWLLLFPLVLATGVWESSWQTWASRSPGCVLCSRLVDCVLPTSEEGD